jgi:DNA polymerase III subunit gamma/tau
MLLSPARLKIENENRESRIMAYTVLARRYRSATFDEVIGQNHVAQTLKKAITSGRIAHAFLFSGTRGVGKTSMARILAKALNCAKADGPTPTPCLKCDSCLAIARGDDIDVIEIDAASNTQVEKTREVVLENAQYRPARSRFKIFIIDEVHMLSKASFNALLKTLEEPPEHVKFILATTEPEKVLATIHSRCQRYDFRNIPTREIAEHLRAICKDEKIKADEDALMLVAKAGAGSMRDSLSLLDRLLSIGEKQLNIESIEQLLGLPRAQRVLDLVQAIGDGRVKDVLAQADRMISEGLSADALLAALVDHLRNLLVIRACGADSTLVEVAAISMEELAKQAQRFEPATLSQDITLMEDLRRQLRQTQAGRALLDATLVRLAMADQFTSIAELLARVDGGAGLAPAQKKKLADCDAGLPPATPRSTGVPPVSPQPPAESPRHNPISAPPAQAGSPHHNVEDDDDDLPRPGKVWEGPSLAETMRQSATPPPPRQPAAEVAPLPGQSPAPVESNIEPVDPNNLGSVWRALLGVMHEHGPSLHGLLSAGQLTGVEDDQAVIRYTAKDEFCVKMLQRNGKRELVCDAMSRVLGRAIGVKFEVSGSAPGGAPAAAVPSPAAARPAPPASQPPPRSSAAPAASAPPPAPTRLTPEQVAQFERDPLIHSLMSELGAIIVRLTDD